MKICCLFERRILSQLSFFCCAALGSVAIGTAAHAATYYVATTGNNGSSGSEAAPFATIQRGLDAASTNDTVFVNYGTYSGDGNRDLNFNGKGITLRSIYGANETIIDCGGSFSANHRGFNFVTGETASAVAQGFTVQNGYALGNMPSDGAAAGALYIKNSSPNIRNCIFKNNVVSATNTAAGSSAYVVSGSPTFTNCLFTANRAGANNHILGTVYAVSNSNLTLVNCTVSGNQAIDLSQASITSTAVAVDSSSLTIRNSIIYGNTGGNELEFNSAPSVTVTYTDLLNGPQIGVGGTGNIDADPQFTSSTDFHLNRSSPAINTGTNTGAPPDDLDGISRPRGGIVDMGAYEYSQFVDSLTVTTLADEDDGTSDPTVGAGTSLREAINFANLKTGVDTIPFASGLTGTLTLTSGLPTIDSPTTIAGPGKDQLTISGNPADPAEYPNANYFPLFSITNSTTAISGLTLTKGATTFAGGAINVGSGAELILNNCTLSQNRAGADGQTGFGGGAISAISATVTINNCDFSNNNSIDEAGALRAEDSSVTIQNSLFHSNSARIDGGAMTLFGGTVKVSNSTLSGNYSEGGGAAIFNNGSDLTLESNTLADNGGSVTLANFYQATLTSNIFKTDSSNATIFAPEGGVISGGYNLTSDGADGNLNGTGDILNTDPKLASLSNNGGPTQTYALLAGSPALDKGNPSTTLTTDQRGAGYPRVVNGRADIGAYEGALPVSVSVSLSSTSPKTGDVLTATPTPTNFGGTPTYTYLWKKGSTVLSTTGPSLNLATAGNGDKGDVITVTVTATSGGQSATSAPASATVVNSAPANTGISPSFLISQFGVAKYFTATYSDPDGYADLSNVQMIVGATLATANVLNVSYDAPTNKLYLRNDAGTALLGGFAPGSNNVITNSQGSLNCAATTVGRSGSTLTVNWNITPAQAFIGTKNLYLYSKDASGATAGWNDLSDWVIKASTNSAPSNTSFAPASSANIVGTARSFGAVYSDPDGALDIGSTNLLINTTLNTSNALWCYYDSTANKLYLKNDAGSALLGGFAPGSANTISNSQGSLNCANTVVAHNGNALTVYWNVTPSASFVGTKNVFMYVKDSVGATAGWNDLGDWLVKSPTNSAPTNVSLAPANSANAINTARSFGAVYSDPDGALDITSVQFIINSTLTQANGLVPSYDPATDKLFLKNDAGTALIGGFTPGSANVISNSQGSLNCANTVVVRNGNTLTVYWNVTPSASFTGVKNLYNYVRDASNASAGFTDMGDWLVKAPGNLPPTVVSVTPSVSSSAVGVAKSLSAVYSDGDGALDISNAQLLINTSISPSKAIWGYYDSETNKLYLKNEAGTALVGGFAPGSNNVISNNQGSLNCAATSVSRSGNTLTVNWNFTPNASFVGTKNLYLYVNDTGGNRTAFNDKGDWTITAGMASMSAPPTISPSGGSS